MRVAGPAAELWDLARAFAAETGWSLRIVSGNDHDHAGRAHYEDRALDLHGVDAALDGLAAFYGQLGARVFWRAPGHQRHLHVEVPETRR